MRQKFCLCGLCLQFVWFGFHLLSYSAAHSIFARCSGPGSGGVHLCAALLPAEHDRHERVHGGLCAQHGADPDLQHDLPGQQQFCSILCLSTLFCNCLFVCFVFSYLTIFFFTNCLLAFCVIAWSLFLKLLLLIRAMLFNLATHTSLSLHCAGDRRCADKC